MNYSKSSTKPPGELNLFQALERGRLFQILKHRFRLKMVLCKLKQLRWNFKWNELFNMEQPTLLCLWMYICFKTNQMDRMKWIL